MVNTTTILCAIDAAKAQGADVIAVYAVPAMFDSVEHAWILLDDGDGEYRVTTHRSDEGNEFGQGYRFDKLADAHVAFTERTRRAMQDQAIWSSVLLEREREATRKTPTPEEGGFDAGGPSTDDRDREGR